MTLEDLLAELPGVPYVLHERPVFPVGRKRIILKTGRATPKSVCIPSPASPRTAPTWRPHNPNK